MPTAKEHGLWKASSKVSNRGEDGIMANLGGKQGGGGALGLQGKEGAGTAQHTQVRRGRGGQQKKM